MTVEAEKRNKQPRARQGHSRAGRGSAGLQGQQEARALTVRRSRAGVMVRSSGWLLRGGSVRRGPKTVTVF